MNLLDRFSTHLRDVLSRAIALASELKNPKVEPVHLLAALSNQTGSVGAELIERFRLNNSALHKALKSLPASSPLTQPTLPGSIAAGVLTPLSGSSKSALEQTLQVAHQSGHSYVGTEHLLFALISLSNDQINNVLKKTGLTAAELNKQIDIALANASHFPQIAEMVDVAERLNENLNDTSIEPMPLKSELPKRVSKKDSALDFFATNLTTEEAQKNIDPVIGRTTEIDRLIQILCRRTKNNPLLLGEPGVGKTAIAEGLAKKILAGNVPEVLMRKKIYALDMGLLIAGTMYRGEFEGRLRSVIEEVSQNQDIVLFIDEIHNIIGAGSNQGTMDAANILKPALARGLIRCIGATTPGEYKKYIEQDAALERRFQPINVKEPSIQATKKILAGIKGNYESYHGVVITPGAIDAAVRLSTRYLAKAHLPDKAIDLLDETAAAKKTKIKKSELAKKLWQTELELERIIVNKELAAQEDRFKDAVKSKATEKKTALPN